jgi:hypothetical protein
VHNFISYSSINFDKFCIDQIKEICAVTLLSFGRNICKIAVYRAPSANFLQFLTILDRALNIIYCPSIEFIIFGDIKYHKDISGEKTS